ncbi:hypothetical protein [uncultured Polaribacter sp.]|uniref:hypothetical protein n=1 Tax=uncultured Polaribacter sp. TaxID=174711 RepID=UPI00259B597C|nr:hypothetical protein [uncultured Polaribacter sp.]
MLKSILSILLLFSVSVISCQEKKDQFPDNALGIYKGDLIIMSTKGKQTIPMEFHLQKTDSVHKFKYVLVYNGSPRNYTLIEKNKEKGIFEVDENNGIVLPTKYADNILYSFFEVQGNFLSSRLHFKKDTLDFEILFTKTKNKVTSGGLSKEIPTVYGYPISTVQKAILKKQK